MFVEKVSVSSTCQALSSLGFNFCCKKAPDLEEEAFLQNNASYLC